MARLMAALLAAAMLSTACGKDDAPAVARETTQSLGDIRSGELDLELTFFGDAGRPEEVTFAMTGVFALPEAGELPEVDVEYTRDAGEDSISGRFVSDGEEAFVERGGERIPLAPDQLAGFTGSKEGEGSIFEELEVDAWMLEPELAEPEDGEQTVTSPLDVAAALNDLMQLAADAGAVTSYEPLEGEDADRLRAASEGSTITLTRSEDDGLLRHLLVEMKLALEGDSEAARTLGDISGGMRLDLRLDQVNENVDVG